MGKADRGSISDRFPSEPLAYLVDGPISRPSGHASPGAGPALLVFKFKWKLKLQIPVVLEM